MTTAAVTTAATAVIAVTAALDAVRAAHAASPSCPAAAAALAVTEAALELANQCLDSAIGAESIDWRPGLCESLVAGE